MTRWIGLSMGVVLSGLATPAIAEPPTARFEDAPRARPMAPARTAGQRQVDPPRKPAASAPDDESLPKSGLDADASASSAPAPSKTREARVPRRRSSPRRPGVDPFAQDPILVNPWAHYDLVSPEVDELLIVDPYGRTRATSKRKPSPETPQRVEPDPSKPAWIRVVGPKNFKGDVYVNGVRLSAPSALVTVIAGEHSVTVVPEGGVPVTVWLEVPGGEQRRFRFVEGSATVAATEPPRSR